MVSADLRLLKFEASWCGPCRAIAPIVDKMAGEWDFEIEKVDIDERPEMAEEYGVMGVPTLVMLEYGSETHRVVGAKPQSVLERELGLM